MLYRNSCRFLGVVYTMEYRVVLRLCKICDWPRLGTTLLYTKEKNVRVTVKFEIPKRHILRPTLSTNTVQQYSVMGEAKEVF
jgi:hypothetical protein